MSSSVGALMRTATTCTAAIVAAAGLAALSPAAEATSDTVCDGTIGRRTVDRVVIPNRASCRLNGTTVRQNVVVSPRASLVTHNAMLLGSVQATEAPRSVQILDTNVRGNIHVREATGRVLIGNAGCSLDPSAGNNIHLVDNSGPIGLCRMRIRGNVHAINNTGTVFMLRNKVGNNLHARGNSGEFLRLRGNRVGTHSNGNLDVRRNRTEVRLRLNSASNHMVCRGNRSISGFGNHAGDGMRRIGRHRSHERDRPLGVRRREQWQRGSVLAVAVGGRVLGVLLLQVRRVAQHDGRDLGGPWRAEHRTVEAGPNQAW